MSGVSESEIQRWALDASDWLWGMVQGAWNAKQSTSQIIVDAVIGMVPLLGDVTAARDLIAVSTRLAEDPQKREETMEWVLLVILLFALIPVIGGVIKGVGRLLLKAGANAAKEAKAIEEIIQFLNRIGHGDAVKWLKSLDLMQYQGQLLEKFHGLMDQLVEALRAIKERLGSLTSAAMRSAIDLWIKRFGEVKALGARKIPQALKELNARLKRVQQAVYKGEWHGVQPGSANVTREAEARLLDEHAPLPKPKRVGFAQNKLADYEHVEGWPNLRNYTEKLPRGSKAQPRNSVIEAFSGPMKAVELKPGQTVYRILKPVSAGKKGNRKAGEWWIGKMPETPEEWRTLWAVLDKFNKNSYVIKYTIPEGTTLKAWQGKAAEQFDEAVGQYLPGGGEQLFVEFSEAIKSELEKLPALPTGWGKTTRRFGYEDTKAARLAARTEQLGANEIEPKRSRTTN